MMTAQEVDRAAVLSALEEAAEAATDDWTHVAVCPNNVHLRATRRWYDQCGRCGQAIPTGNVGPYTWCDEHACHQGVYNHQHGCGEHNWPTEVEIDLTEELPDEVEVDPEDLPWWADEVAGALVERVVRMLDDACTSEQQDEAERIEDRLRARLRGARAVLAANARVGEDPIGDYIAAMRRRDEADDEDERVAAEDDMEAAADLLYLYGIYPSDPTPLDPCVYFDVATGRLWAWDWARTTDPETGWSDDVIEVGED